MGKSNYLINSSISKTAKLFNGIRIINSVIGDRARIGDDCDIVNLRMQDKTELGRRNIIRDAVIGKGSYTGTNTIIKNTDIGRFCCISWNVSIGGGNHDYHHISMYTDYWYHRNFGIALPETRHETIRTTIGNDVWIGAGAVINNGVVIGNGCVIGAGAVIVGDVPSWSIVAGVPGTTIKRRFDEEVSEALEVLGWWNWEDELIVKYHNILSSVPDIGQIYRIMEEIGVQNSDN